MQEEVARSEGFRPMNATFGQVFDKFYTPFDDTELRLAPSATPNLDPNAKMCFKESDIYEKCPQLIPPPPPPPKNADGSQTVCTTYQPATGDGYTQQFGDIPYGGGFSPLVPSNKLEPMHFGGPPRVGSLQTAKTADLAIKSDLVTMKLPGRMSRCVSSIKYKNVEYMNPNGIVMSTAAFDVPKGANDKLTRVDESKTNSKPLDAFVSANGVYTKTQAAYLLIPGSVVNGKVVPHKSTLSSTVMTKNVTIGSGHVARYISGAYTSVPFRSVRLSMPRFTLLPDFNHVYGYDTSVHRWTVIPTTKTELSASSYGSVIVSNASGKYAIGLRVVDAPKPTTFGSKFANKLSYFVSRNKTGTPVAIVQSLGSRGGNAGGVMAPSGTYSVTVDMVFGTRAEVQKILDTVVSPTGKCPSPIATGNVSSSGTVISSDADTATIEYIILGKKKTVTYQKKGHGLTHGARVTIIIDPITGKVTTVTWTGKAAGVKIPKGDALVHGKVLTSKTKLVIVEFMLNKKTRKVAFKRTMPVLKPGMRVDVLINKHTGKVVDIVIPGSPGTVVSSTAKSTVVIGTVTYAHGSTYKMKYAFKGKAVSTQLAAKSHVTFAKTHKFKVGSKAYLTLSSSGKIASMSMTRPVTTVAKPKAAVKTTTVTGTVASKTAHGYKVNYTFAKKPMATYVSSPMHTLKIGSHVTLHVDSHGTVVPPTAATPTAAVKKPVYKAPIAMTAATKNIKAGTGLVSGVYPVPAGAHPVMEYDIEFPYANMIHTLEFKTKTQKLKKNQIVKLTMDSHGTVLKVNGEPVVA